MVDYMSLPDKRSRWMVLELLIYLIFNVRLLALHNPTRANNVLFLVRPEPLCKAWLCSNFRLNIKPKAN